MKAIAYRDQRFTIIYSEDLPSLHKREVHDRKDYTSRRLADKVMPHQEKNFHRVVYVRGAIAQESVKSFILDKVRRPGGDQVLVIQIK